MKFILLFIAGICSLTSNAQDYLITFTGSGTTSVVSQVRVENLAKGTSLTLNGDETLRLTTATIINQTNSNPEEALRIYPNPAEGYATLEFTTSSPGDAVVSLTDMTGKTIAELNVSLENSKHLFRLSGLKNGFYFVSVDGKYFHLSGRLISKGNFNGYTKIEKLNPATLSMSELVPIKASRGIQVTVDMAYTPGDRLKFTGISGIYSTVKTDIPATDKIIDFEFITCTDGDNNNYPVVKIGTQIWMAANLKTTSYNEGSAIQYTSDETEWKGLTTPGYCWYGNNEAANKDIYGALYNWFTVNAAVNGNKNACPVGWSVPDENDWTTLTTFLGGENTAGGRLKETGLSHWLSPNTGATDEYGFAALPGGLRGYLGAYNDTGTGGLWWSSIQYDATNAWNRQITNTMSDFSYYSYEKQYGFSVRCLQD